ncbi:sigma 54-interacting transcriptional regulator [Vagococcus lutrae]|uniref:sigma 54-interacting transcriptional regulator n=1 Tax=Vagococcus lutrae TaxID=81947 RepID=UPI00200F9D78|nr:sigma-54-dependent transcriptional regulator [Vagococcus lutrae]MDT2805909.1 sigma 54-interacting transcriptional regulator [Vagococcus lutrae]MDT2823889.1 sigma 54-interacting transcriptional regulator [Vagococcus lutrae]UQF18073.1 sigma 54-interacting transcriptional regulator [Vagococcus lutrae]
MSNRKEQIFRTLATMANGGTANDIADAMGLERSNVSRYLNELVKEQRVARSQGRPVVFTVTEKTKTEQFDITFDNLVGANESLSVSIQQAKAAILYPPKGLHTIVFGETGTGKSLFAECMYRFAVSSESIQDDAPFVSFNCADYAQNPQLLFAHIFGVKKGAYTGANEDRQGLLAEAHGGILFLDEIHRLPPEGQEMLFTFIDKGEYRPLGESAKVHEASVQIIGATTENSDMFLTTFNRRIPMSITLPPLRERSIDERYEIVTLFIKQEADRLQQKIIVEREAILAFMLYHAEGNIGQVKRDLKLVCAKAFLNYRTHQEDYLTIHQKDLPLQVQKGLLKIKEMPERIDRFVDKNSHYLTFEPGTNEVVWSLDPARDMSVYSTIEEKVSTLTQQELETLDLESYIEANVDQYFEAYVDELARSNIHQDLIEADVWELTNRLYDVAEERLDRSYHEKARFTFALHLQGTLERIKDNRSIIHPNLNDIRIHYKKEFKVAIDLSAMIEEAYEIEIPFDEIGFITMFLAIDTVEPQETQDNQVAIVLLMHGKSTASSMLEAVQELLGTTTGTAFNMPLTMEVQHMYEQVKNYVIDHKEQMASGMLLLTDMGSLNTFGNMIYEETGVRTKAISMVSTMIVLEAVRMASIGRSLEDIYQNVQMSFENIVRTQFRPEKQRDKAVIVTCFTGEGVATKLYERIQPVVNTDEVEIIQMQFLEKEAFKKHIDRLMEQYDIKAIVGTVDIEYQNIPFFSAFDIFNNDKLNELKRLAANELSIGQIIASLEGTMTTIESVSELLLLLQHQIRQIQSDMQVIVEPGIDAAILIHLAFLVEALNTGVKKRDFENLEAFKRQHLIAYNAVQSNLMPVEKRYHLEIPESEIAYVAQMFIENRIKQSY